MSHVVTRPPAPGTGEWRRRITPSKVPAILGVSPFTSPFALWHEMHGDLDPEPLEGDHLDWGHMAEESLVRWWLLKNPGWRANKGEITYTNPDLPFPNLATLDRRAVRGRRYAIIECKTSRDMNKWGREGEPDSVPMNYVAQVITQMGISGIREAHVVVLGGGTPEIHQVPWDEKLWGLIVQRCIAWQQSLDDGVPPPLDDSPATYKTLRGLHPDISEGTTVDIDLDQATAYLQAVHAAKAAAAVEQEQKNLLMQVMGRAQKAMCGPTVVATRRPSSGGPALYANTRAVLDE